MDLTLGSALCQQGGVADAWQHGKSAAEIVARGCASWAGTLDPGHHRHGFPRFPPPNLKPFNLG